MKTEAEVQDHIRLLLDQEFERRAIEAATKLPRRCVHNHRQPLDSRKQVNGEGNEDYNRIVKNGLPVVQTIGLCMYGSTDPTNWNGTICEDPIDAQRCPLFTPKVTREEIQQALEGQIRDIEWVKVNLPEVHALLWTLDSNKLPASDPPPPPEPETAPLPCEPEEEQQDDEDAITPVPPPPLAWWKSWLLKLLGVTSKQLPPPNEP